MAQRKFYDLNYVTDTKKALHFPLLCKINKIVTENINRRRCQRNQRSPDLTFVFFYHIRIFQKTQGQFRIKHYILINSNPSFSERIWDIMHKMSAVVGKLYQETN